MLSESGKCDFLSVLGARRPFSMKEADVKGINQWINYLSVETISKVEFRTPTLADDGQPQDTQEPESAEPKDQLNGRVIKWDTKWTLLHR